MQTLALSGTDHVTKVVIGAAAAAADDQQVGSPRNTVATPLHHQTYHKNVKNFTQFITNSVRTHSARKNRAAPKPVCCRRSSFCALRTRAHVFCCVRTFCLGQTRSFWFCCTCCNGLPVPSRPVRCVALELLGRDGRLCAE